MSRTTHYYDDKELKILKIKCYFTFPLKLRADFMYFDK